MFSLRLLNKSNFVSFKLKKEYDNNNNNMIFNVSIVILICELTSIRLHQKLFVMT